MVTASTSLLVTTLFHGTSSRAFFPRAFGANVNPRWMICNSLGETARCSAGVSRLSTYQTSPASKPMMAQAKNEDLQPKRDMMNVMSGGDNPAPAPTPANIQPFAKPRSLSGIQRATNWLDAG